MAEFSLAKFCSDRVNLPLMSKIKLPDRDRGQQEIKTVIDPISIDNYAASRIKHKNRGIIHASKI